MLLHRNPDPCILHLYLDQAMGLISKPCRGNNSSGISELYCIINDLHQNPFKQ